MLRCAKFGELHVYLWSIASTIYEEPLYRTIGIVNESHDASIVR